MIFVLLAYVLVFRNPGRTFLILPFKNLEAAETLQLKIKTGEKERTQAAALS